MTERLPSLPLPRALLCAVLGLCLTASAAPVIHHSGADEDKVVVPDYGALLLGGGREPDEAVRWLLELAKGGDVVVLRASGGDGYNDYFYEELGGVNSVRSIVFSSREQAFDETVLDLVERAELIFLAGGDQAKYVRYWKGTPLQILINAHARAGKPIGGTSAGLAVMGGVAYAALGDSIRSRTALRDPFSEDLTLESDFLRLPFLERVLTDSHFSERGRLGRMLAFQARASAPDPERMLLAVGVDEMTALAVDASGLGRVYSRTVQGRVYCAFYLPETEIRLVEGEPLSVGPLVLTALGRESRINLGTLEVDAPASLSGLEVVDGRIRPFVQGEEP